MVEPQESEVREIITKTCKTCEHYPNDKHCIGCKWDKSKGENTKWELKKNPIVIERKVLEQIRAEIDSHCSENRDRNDGLYIAMKIIDKYKASEEISEHNMKMWEEIFKAKRSDEE